jgi:hypothetical protein
MTEGNLGRTTFDGLELLLILSRIGPAELILKALLTWLHIQSSSGLFAGILVNRLDWHVAVFLHSAIVACLLLDFWLKTRLLSRLDT